jgi:hypothetical protein
MPGRFATSQILTKNSLPISNLRNPNYLIGARSTHLPFLFRPKRIPHVPNPPFTLCLEHWMNASNSGINTFVQCIVAVCYRGNTLSAGLRNRKPNER